VAGWLAGCIDEVEKAASKAREDGRGKEDI